MKLVLSLLLCMTLHVCIYAQTKTYVSKISDTRCVRVTVTSGTSGTQVHYDNIAYDAALTSSIYNEVGASVADGVLTIPARGNYWIVPFDGMPMAAGNGKCWDYWCECSGGGGGCHQENYGGGQCITCQGNSYDPCNCCSLHAEQIDCSTKAPIHTNDAEITKLKGGFILIQANSVTVN